MGAVRRQIDPKTERFFYFMTGFGVYLNYYELDKMQTMEVVGT